MYRTKARSYYWLILAGCVAASGCSDDEDTDGTGTVTEPDAGSSDAGTMTSDATTADGDVEEPDASTSDASMSEEPDATTPESDASTPDSGGGLTPTELAFMRGQAVADANDCATCHRDDFAGVGFYPNITPDVATGIGSWTDAQIGAAITGGVNELGESLCGLMMEYPLTDDELADLIVFLKGIPAVSKNIPVVCPGHGS